MEMSPGQSPITKSTEAVDESSLERLYVEISGLIVIFFFINSLNCRFLRTITEFLEAVSNANWKNIAL